jgi:hypothetical protein
LFSVSRIWSRPLTGSRRRSAKRPPEKSPVFCKKKNYYHYYHYYQRHVLQRRFVTNSVTSIIRAARTYIYIYVHTHLHTSTHTHTLKLSERREPFLSQCACPRRHPPTHPNRRQDRQHLPLPFAGIGCLCQVPAAHAHKTYGGRLSLSLSLSRARARYLSLTLKWLAAGAARKRRIVDEDSAQAGKRQGGTCRIPSTKSSTPFGRFARRSSMPKSFSHMAVALAPAGVGGPSCGACGAQRTAQSISTCVAASGRWRRS